MNPPDGAQKTVAPQPEAAIRIRGLRKAYGRQVIIDGLDLDVYRGDFVALLGHSGCGKSTLLRLLAGFERPDEGQIDIFGRCVNVPAFVPPEQRRVGMVFQDYALFPHLTVAGNIGYGLATGPGRADRIREVMQLVGLDGLDQRYPHTLSGGQQQRVALARALAPQPDVILLDEPFSSLDAGLRSRIGLEVRHILRLAGATALFVTHDQEEAMSLADRVAVMQGGRILQKGRPATLYLSPATRDLAAFFGEANFLVGQADGSHVQTILGRLPLQQQAQGDVDVMLRPEWLTVHPDPAGNAVVLYGIYYGHDQLITVRAEGGQLLQVRLLDGTGFSPGDRVRLEIGHAAVAYPADLDQDR